VAIEAYFQFRLDFSVTQLYSLQRVVLTYFILYLLTRATRAADTCNTCCWRCWLQLPSGVYL